jgi:hypothetical protein
MSPNRPRMTRPAGGAARVLVAVAACAVALAGCGSPSSSPPPPQQAARSDASAACRYLLVLGSAIQHGQPVTTAAAVKTLQAATAAANNAATLDKSWNLLASTVTDIAKYLETGQRFGLGGTLADLSLYCKPLVPTSGA